MVDSYALDMKRGYWALNHQGICFDEDGTLIDGQHRLAAIVLSGKTIKMYVFRNMQKQYGQNGELGFVQDTIDDMKKRSVGDKLKLSYDIENGTIAAAMVNVIINIASSKTMRRSLRITKAVYEIYRSEIEKVIKSRQNVRGLAPAAVLGSFAFAAKVFSQKVIDFENGYFSGENLSKGSPILAFRNQMLTRDIGEMAYNRRRIISCTLTVVMSLKKPCKHPLCSGLTSAKHGYCRTHIDYMKEKHKEADSSRPSSRERGYTTDWDKLRDEWLRAQPICQGCGRVNRQAATQRMFTWFFK